MARPQLKDVKTKSDDPVVVELPSTLDTKSATTAVSLMRRALPRKLHQVNGIQLNFLMNYTSSAASNNAAITSLEPSVAGDFAAYAILYDEVIVHSAEVKFFVFNSGTNPVVSFAGVAFDPMDNTPLGSSSNLVTYSQHFDFVHAPATAVSPIPHTPRGYWTFHCQVPKGKSARSAVFGSTLFSGEWGSTKDSADVWGFVKYFIPAQGSSTTSTIVTSTTLDCSFRSRQ